MLRIKDEPLYRYNVTLAAVSIGTQSDEWVFLPFDTESCELFAASPTKLVAFSDSGAIRLFDVEKRSCIIDAPAGISGRSTYLQPWAWSEARSAFYIGDFRREGGVALRVIQAITGRDEEHKFPELQTIRTLTARAEGDVIVWGTCDDKYNVAQVDLAAGKIGRQIVPGFDTRSRNQHMCEPRWPSWDGRFILRYHLAAVLRDDPATRRRFDPMQTNAQHPDLAGSTEKRYAIAVDLYRTWPFAHTKRIVLRYLSGEEIKLGGRNEINLAVLDRLANESERRQGASAQAQFLCTLPLKPRLANIGIRPDEYTDEEELQHRAESAAVLLLLILRNVIWDDDSKGFTAHFTDQTFRHCTLNGDVGPIQHTPHCTTQMISASKRKPIVAALRRRTSRTIKLPDTAANSLANGMAKIGADLEGGLGKLIHNGILGWTFDVGGKKIPESAFYAHVRASPAADQPLLLEPLRAIFCAYAGQIGSVRINGEQLYSLEHEPDDEENVHAALGEAAVALATLDPDAHRLLKSWFASVDSEHDVETVDRVFNAIADCTGFGSVDLITFGLWFERMMVQKWKESPAMVHLLASAKDLLTPDSFAATAYAGALADATAGNVPPVYMLFQRMQELLATDDSPWAKQALLSFGDLTRKHETSR